VEIDSDPDRVRTIPFQPAPKPTSKPFDPETGTGNDLYWPTGPTDPITQIVGGHGDFGTDTFSTPDLGGRVSAEKIKDLLAPDTGVAILNRCHSEECARAISDWADIPVVYNPGEVWCSPDKPCLSGTGAWATALPSSYTNGKRP
jgi:hypothetical protein